MRPETSLFFIFLYFRSGMCEEPVYAKKGGEVVLNPQKTRGPYAQILWKFGDDFAMEYLGGQVQHYEPFEKRGSLNISTGEMTIREATFSDSGVYTVEINGEVNKKMTLKVMASVLKPNVSSSCSDNYCDLTCVGDTVDAAPVSFLWIIGSNRPQEKSKEYRLTKDVTAEFIRCELENTVSSQQSDKFRNPFVSAGGKGSLAQILTGLFAPIGVLLLLCVVVYFLYRAGIITNPIARICPGRATGVEEPRYDRTAQHDDDSTGGSEAAAGKAEDHSNGPTAPAAKTEDNPSTLYAVVVERPGTSTDPTQTANGNGDAHISSDNKGNADALKPDDKPGDAQISSDNKGNADASKPDDKSDDGKSAPDDKQQQDEIEDNEH